MPRRQVAAALLTVAFLGPLAFLVLGALHPIGGISPSGADILPSSPSLTSFERAFDLQPLGRQLVNSLIVVAFAVPLTVLTASWAGFGMTLLRPGPRRIAIVASLVLLVVPLPALWVPRFVMFAEADLTDTYVPLIAPALMGTTSFYVLLFHWSYRRLPTDLLDAARLEGLGPWATWRRVASPLVRPTTFAVGALAFVFHWGNFIDPLLYLSDPDRYTLPLGLNALRGLAPGDFPARLAAALVATVPAVIAFALVQGRFLSGTRGAGWLGR